MSIDVRYNGETFVVPTTGDVKWGKQVTSLLRSLAGVLRNFDTTEVTIAPARLQATLDRLPLRLDSDAIVYLPAGDVTGAEISGYTGAGALNLVGATTVITGTGSMSGTAGSGTAPTSLVKPTGASNWVASALVNKFLKLTSGGGAGDEPELYPVLRPILANTTTTLTVESVPGMDLTTQFQIVELASELVAIEDSTDAAIVVRDNPGNVVLRGLKFSATGLDSLLSISRCAHVELDGCHFSEVGNDAALQGLKNSYLTINNCIFDSGADAQLDRCQFVDVANVKMAAAGQLAIADAFSVEITKLESAAAVGTVLRAERVQSMRAEVKADNGGATPIYLETVAAFEAWGSNKLTGSGNTGYGLQIEKSGRYTLTGSNITGGSGDVLFLDDAGTSTWTNLSSPTYGIVEEHAASAVASSSYGKALKRGNYLFEGNIDLSGRLLQYGYNNVSSNLIVPTFSASESYDMETNGVRGFLECVCNSASAQVVLPSNAAIAGVLVSIYNRGSQALTVVPPADGTLNGTASLDIPSNGIAVFFSLNGHSGHDYTGLVMS
jgi:hypothetical protein